MLASWKGQENLLRSMEWYICVYIYKLYISFQFDQFESLRAKQDLSNLGAWIWGGKEHEMCSSYTWKEILVHSHTHKKRLWCTAAHRAVTVCFTGKLIQVCQVSVRIPLPHKAERSLGRRIAQSFFIQLVCQVCTPLHGTWESCEGGILKGKGQIPRESPWIIRAVDPAYHSQGKACSAGHPEGQGLLSVQLSSWGVSPEEIHAQKKCLTNNCPLEGLFSLRVKILSNLIY